MMREELGAGELDAFVDGELDLSRQLIIERELANDPTLRARMEALKTLRSALREHGTYHAAGDDLRRRIAAMAPPAHAGAIAPRRWTWRPMTAALGATLVVALALQIALSRRSDEMRLADQVVASHVRSALGERLVDVASSDHHVVKPWLSARLDYSPPVRDTQLGDVVFVGGRIDYLDGRPVAALVYRKGPHRVNWFIWPSTGADRTEKYASDRGFEIAHWTRDGMTNWVVSDVNRTEFARMVDVFAATGPAP